MEKIIQAQTIDETIAVFGSFDFNIKLMEKAFDVKITNRGETIKVVGEDEACEKTASVFENLFALVSNGEEVTEQAVRYAIDMAQAGLSPDYAKSADTICISSKGRPVKCKTKGQQAYVDKIRNNTVVIAIGPAGTGKTYLAVAMAVDAFRKKEVSRIILTRPAVEAGEKLGFLPGDLQMKVDPYLRPLYDALSDMLGFENYQKYVERGSIEVAPLAYMRGRTLDDAFIILDEAQNTTPEQMKMFLTRLGFNSKMVVTGDVTQIDLPDGRKSGLKEILRILRDVEDIAICEFSQKDVVRHQLVQRIIEAYERYEKAKPQAEERKRMPHGKGKSSH